MTCIETTTPLALELAFTKVFQKHQDAPIALREAHCWRVLLPAILAPIEEGDLLAGRIDQPAVGMGLEKDVFGYYAHLDAIDAVLAAEDLDPDHEWAIREMRWFWQTHCTTSRVVEAMSDPVRAFYESPTLECKSFIAAVGPRLSGTFFDYDKLLTLGLPGLREAIVSQQRSADAEQSHLYEAMLICLDLVRTNALHYAGQTHTASQADALRAIADRPPATLHEAMQLMWLYAIPTGTVNFGRMDVYFGDFLANDLADGRLDEEQAQALVDSLWRLVIHHCPPWNGRIVVGGAGRRNPENANRFAMMAMEATRRNPDILPQLTLRLHDGQDPALFEKALDVLGEGNTFPMLYNDDVNVPAVEHAFQVSREEALTYMPLGCGEYILDHRSIGSPNSALNLLKALNVTLHGGVDPFTNAPLGITNPQLGDFATFEELWDAYAKQVEYHVRAVAAHPHGDYQALAKERAFVFESMLYDNCVESGKPLLQGVPYVGASTEVFGIINAGDALAAIKKLVFDEKQFSLQELRAALGANFEGHEHIWRVLKAVPKYGNDNEETDAMVARVHEHICNQVRNTHLDPASGLHSFLVVNINNSHNVIFGRYTAASADGRRAGEPLANGNNPTAGNDTGGVTAFLKSLAKLDPTIHAGAVQNMKFTPTMFKAERPKLEALLQTYFALGGAQAMLSVVDKGMMEEAIREPEKHQNLIVRVGGFSARFVELEPELQRDLLARTLH